MNGFRGGYNVRLDGRPSRGVDVLAAPERLYLPLRSQTVAFTNVTVADHQVVLAGETLATAPGSFDIPLLAPLPGTVHLNATDGHIVLDTPPEDAMCRARPPEATGPMQDQLVARGAWEFLRDIHTGRVPSPLRTPQAAVVSTVQLEPFQTRGDVLLARDVPAFIRGLGLLHALMGEKPLFLAIPNAESEITELLQTTAREHPWITIVHVPLRYPAGDLRLLARRVGLRCDAALPVWGTGVAGVLAVDAALTHGKAATTRVVTLGGPGAPQPRHVEVHLGYPLEKLLPPATGPTTLRVLNGGALTGAQLDPGQCGIDNQCAGLTMVKEHESREFFGFLRAGSDRPSASRCFLSTLRRPTRHALTTALRGEHRACVACGHCESRCPAGIMPSLLHKCLWAGDEREAERLRLDLCVECGLCTYVCPAKINLQKQFGDAKENIRSRQCPAPRQIQ
ncbi:MAG: hypothetical protein HN742_30050 [Lentisphaerae bacterium]|jgi:Na+-transporting NADH:ubiquinone oxidoreductase subunit A|nr:hypothetical protein [Lentisphaerota bacterium]MBT5612684.1 hypothetical protein [Lentisphaerota bacterium]MBT7057558.1 hypothetical protein [Lentisphaerota bacterium]MBT7846153.1 hypothetical protein [Lentisphaerota bacterium]